VLEKLYDVSILDSVLLHLVSCGLVNDQVRSSAFSTFWTSLASLTCFWIYDLVWVASVGSGSRSRSGYGNGGPKVLTF
jgi:hypothetical protein